MSPAQDPDAVEAARLRAAHQRLDERPSPGVRAAVLRAAADSANGKPVGQTVTMLQQRPARSWFGWRPAAAGATVAVGILAVGLAIHVEHEPTIESLPAAPAATLSAPRAAPVPAPAPAPSPAHQQPAAPASAASTASYKAEESSAAARADRTRPIEAPAPSAALAGRTPSIEPPAPAALPVEPPIEAPAAAAAPVEKARYRVAPPQLQAGAQRSNQTLSPQEWLRRITELRHTGRNAEADDELARFRAAFPNVKVPDDALR